MKSDCRRSFHRRLTFFASVATILSSLFSIPFLQRLPHRPWSLTLPFSLYAAFAALLGVLGLLGALKRRASYVAVFSNYLILDTLCTVPRLLLLVLVLSPLEDSYCPIGCLLTAGGEGAGEQALNPPDRPPNVTERFEAWLEEHSGRRRCSLVVWLVLAQVTVIVLGMLLAQWWVAMRVREHAIRLAREERGTARCARGSDGSAAEGKVEEGEDVETCGLAL